MTELIWNGVRRIPEIFSQADINRILEQILSSDKYWKEGNKMPKEWADFLRTRDFTAIATIYLLGCRPNEACGLQFEDFDLSSSFVRIDGKHNKTKKDRKVAIPSMLIKILTKYLQFPRERFWKGSKYLFPSLASPKLSPATLKSVMREKALKPLGLWIPPQSGKKSKFSLYTLRHSRASHILNKQVEEFGQPDLLAIANILGHADLRSTQVYLHTNKKYQQHLRKLMEL